MTTYGAYGEKMMYGKKVTGVIRSTVWIGPDGKVKKHWARVAEGGRSPREGARSVARVGGADPRSERNASEAHQEGEGLMAALAFPKGFLWGAATASYQIEGAWQRGRQGRVDLGPLRAHAGQDQERRHRRRRLRPLPPLQGRRRAA